MIEIYTLGGYNEVGKNMTVVRVDGEAVIFDMGLQLENYIRFTEEVEDVHFVSTKMLTSNHVVPDITPIEKIKKEVLAIVPTHAHLDHVGAVPFLAKKFNNVPIICTPFTAEVLKTILYDDKIDFKNPIKTMNINSKVMLSKNLELEFINSTHSTPQTVMAALHTKYGTIIYANDFKFDEFPTFGLKSNIEKLREFGEKYDVLALIVDSTYANIASKTPSESVAKQMLKDVMLGTDNSGKGVIVTTFSSHIARLKSIIEFGKQMNRKIYFCGRSLAKYVQAAENINLVNFSDDVTIFKYRKQVKKALKDVEEAREKYLLVVTGHQGEPGSTLRNIAEGKLDFRFEKGDHIIFSCKTIPTQTNIENRKSLENALRKYNVRIFTDIHVSGHASREDLRDLINLVTPKHIIPAHGSVQMRTGLAELAGDMGYNIKKNVHLVFDGAKITIN